MKRIAIVDDSGTARMFIRRCLEIIGLSQTQMIEAKNGREALEMIRQEPVALLISDLTMPEMDGESLLKAIKADPELHEIPVLIISSSTNPARITGLLELGAHGILAKPIKPATLFNALQSLLPGLGAEQK